MARYIDADKMVSKDNAYTTFPHDLAGCDDNDLVRWINEQPTADVAPKSEVAREIIKDLVDLVDRKERLQQRYYETFYYVNSDDLTDFIAELKKKYTEETE